MHAGTGLGNASSIGIEICEHAGIDHAAANQRAALLMAALLQRLGLDISHVVRLASSGSVEKALRGGKPSRGAAVDLNAVLAEHGQCINLPPKNPKIYLTRGKGEAAELYADIRLCVDGPPSELMVRCILSRAERGPLCLPGRKFGRP